MLKEPYSVLATYAFQYGIESQQLENLIDFITSADCKISLTARTCLVRDYLFPRDKVPTKVIVTIISRFSSRSFAPIILFQHLLKWLVTVYDFFEDPFVLSKLYSSLLTKLSYETTRQWVCHLLYLSTTQALVKPWRVNFLMEIYQKYPNSMYIVALLRLYREYLPSLVKGTLPMVKATIFKQPYPEMVSCIRNIHSHSPPNHRTNNTSSLMTSPSKKSIQKELSLKKRPNTSISTLNTPVPPSLFSRYQLNLGIETVTSISQFVEKYHKLKFTDQMASVFNDSGMLSRLLLYKGDELVWNRFDSWLVQMLFSSELNFNIPLMEKIVSFVTYTKELPISVEEYLFEIIKTWDGVSNQDMIFHLMSYLPMLSAESAATKLLTPLKRLIENSGPEMHIAIFNHFQDLIRNWKTLIMANSDQIELSLSEQCRTLRIIAAFVDHYGLIALETFKDNTEIALIILDMFEEITYFPSHGNFPIVITMSSDLIYYLILSRSGIALSRVSGIIIAGKSLHMNAQRDPLIDQSTAFQSFVLDICNSIWLNKAFDDLKPSSTVIHPNRFTVENDFILVLRDASAKIGFNLNTLLSLPHSISFCRLAAIYLRSLENNAKVKKRLMEPPSYSSLKQIGAQGGLMSGFNDFRVGFLDVLDEHGYHGIHNLLYGSMRKLMEKKQLSA